MIEGLLVINLDPAYIKFSPRTDTQVQRPAHANEGLPCTVEQIRDLLIDLDVLSPNQSWPPREYIMRISVEVPSSVLERLRPMPDSNGYIAPTRSSLSASAFSLKDDDDPD